MGNNKAKAKSDQDGQRFLREAFAMEQKALKSQLDLSRGSVSHSGTLGEVNEDIFARILRNYLPRRYMVGGGIVIDRYGKVSDQIDIIIYDNQYTPMLLLQERHRYVPAEAVYAVLEVKPAINKENLEYAADKAASVRKLSRTSANIVHAGGEVKKPKKPFEIIAGIVASDICWQDGFNSEAFKKCIGTLQDKRALNFGLAVSGHYFELSQAKYEPEIDGENTLIYFIFRLLHNLARLGTAPAADWEAYAGMLAGTKGHA